jgi:acetyltransferase-like isoleucine patch superfamily enzyme
MEKLTLTQDSRFMNDGDHVIYTPGSGAKIHPEATVEGGVTIKPGALRIGKGAVVQRGAVLEGEKNMHPSLSRSTRIGKEAIVAGNVGAGAIVGYKARIEKKATAEPYSSLRPFSKLKAGSTLGTGSTIGTGKTVYRGVNIPSHSEVGLLIGSDPGRSKLDGFGQPIL